MKTFNEFLEEGMVSTLKKGVKRHKDAVEKKKIKDRKAVPYAALAAQHEPEGELVEGDVHSGQGEKIQKRTKKWMDKKGQKGAPGLDAMKAREAEHKARRGVSEAKVDDVKYSKDEKRKNYETDVHTLSSNKGVRSDRNKRRSATDVVFHGHSKVERDRKQAHYKSRGVKKVKGVKEEVIDERTLASYIPSDRQGEVHRANLDYTKAQLKKREDESTKNRGNLSKRDAGKMARQRLHNKRIMSMGEDKAFDYVVAKLRKQHGDGVLTKGDKMPEPSAAQKKRNAEIRAQRAKEDHRDETEKATSGRYNDRSRSD
jgi:hypothetical protein